MTTLRLTAKCSRRSAAAGHSYCRASRAIWKRIESCARPGTTRRQRPPKRHTHTYVRFGSLAYIVPRLRHVRFTLDSGHSQCRWDVRKVPKAEVAALRRHSRPGAVTPAKSRATLQGRGLRGVGL